MKIRKGRQSTPNKNEKVNTNIVRKKRKVRKKQNTFYEKALQYIKDSSLNTDVLNVSGTIIQGGKKSKNWKSPKMSKKQTEPLLPEAEFSQNDSVIILSDNENNALFDSHGSGKNMKNGQQSSGIGSQCINTQYTKNKQRVQKCFNVSLDSSCCIISDIGELDSHSSELETNGENIEPIPHTSNKSLLERQNSEDIEVVWSSITNSSKINGPQPNQHVKDTETASKVDSNSNVTMVKSPKSKASESKRPAEVSTSRLIQKSNLIITDPQDGPSANTNVVSAMNTRVMDIQAGWMSTTDHVPNNQALINSWPMKQRENQKGQLREIIIDGNNVAMTYTKGFVFSEKGLMIVIDYFEKRGHTVKVFVPQHRRSQNRPLLEELYKTGIVVFTPSRNIGGKRITPYDDRYILQYATMCGGIIVSSDQYRDLYKEKPEWRETIEKRLLIPTFVGDYVMFPEDPLGWGGPKLDQFLKH